MKRLLTIMIFGLSHISHGQVGDTTQVIQMFSSPEVPAIPSNGFEKYYQWINSNNKLKNVSDSVSLRNKVFLEIRVSKTGTIQEVRVAKSIGEPYDSEAIRLIKENPAPWIPAENRKIKCESTVWLPISFLSERAQNKKKNRP